MVRAMCCAGFLCLAWRITEVPANAQISPPKLEQHWSELASKDEGRAALAMLALAASPKDTTAFLKERLKPVTIDAKNVAKLLSQLDNRDFAIRNKAIQELEYCGKLIRNDLENALTKASAIETIRRIENLLAKLPRALKMGRGVGFGCSANDSFALRASCGLEDGKIEISIDGIAIDWSNAMGPPPLLWMRAARAATILEHFGTDEARQLIESLATGEADALPTTAARASLQRLPKAKR